MIHTFLGKGENIIPALQFESLYSIAGLKHFITTRQGGMSNQNYTSLNLSFLSGDQPDFVEKNRLCVCTAMGIDADHLLVPAQKHTDNIFILDKPPLFSKHSLDNIDALMTDQSGICLMILAADCLPVLLYDQRKRVIAAVHAGWRGTVKKIVPKVIHKMKERWNTDPADILAAIGPSVCKLHYQVGPEVLYEFENAFGFYPQIIGEKDNEGRAHLDLQTCNYLLLIEEGVSPVNIQISGICTFSYPDMLFSARRSGFQSGRFGAGIMLI